MPVSESEKLGVSALECRFSEKAKHIPIKKRRFLFRTSSAPDNLRTPLEGTQRRPMFVNSSSQGLQLSPNATCPPPASAPVADLGQRSNNDSEVDGEKLVIASKKASEDEDFSGISILAAAACSNGLGGDADRRGSLRIVSVDTKSLEAPETVAFKENTEKSANMFIEETDSHTTTAPSTADHYSPDKTRSDNFTRDEATWDSSCSQIPSESEVSRTNQGASKMQKSCARDDRLHWDLNTVMDAWEEPVQCNHEISTADAAGSNITYAEEENRSCKECNAGGWEVGQESGSASESIGHGNLPVDLSSLTHLIEESKLKEHKPNGHTYISKLLSPISAPHFEVKKTKSLHNEHINSSNDAISVAVPSIFTLEYPTCGLSAQLVNHNCMSTNDVPVSRAAGAELLEDCSIPPGFDTCIKMPPSKGNVDVSSSVAGVGNNVVHAINSIQTIMTTTFRSENEKSDLPLTTVASLADGAHQGVSTFREDDEAKVTIAPTSNRIVLQNRVSKWSDNPQETDKADSKEMNKTPFGALVTQSSVAAENPTAVSSIHDAACSDAEAPNDGGKSPLTATSRNSTMLLATLNYHTPHESHFDCSDDLVSSNKKACEDLDNGLSHEHSQNYIQAESGVDKSELSVGYDSQYEDGELRESTVVPWEGYEVREIRENEYVMDNRGSSFNMCTLGPGENSSQYVPEGSSRISVADVGSGRGTCETSTVLLPEKLQGNDQASGSGLNKTKNGTRHYTLKDAGQLDKWKMNVSGWDILPENHSSSTNFTKIRDFSWRNSYNEHNVETKAEGSRFYRRELLLCIGGRSTSDAFPSRGRFCVQRCSSTDADDLSSRTEKESSALRSCKRGKYSPSIHANARGGGIWNHSPEGDRDQKRLHSPRYLGPSFLRSVPEHVGNVDSLSKEGNLDLSDAERPNDSSYIKRQSFRSRSPNREEDEFHARLGLRPSGDTSYNRFLNVERGRSLRYGSRYNGGGPRGYYGPAGDGCDKSSIEYALPFPRRRQCFSPRERKGNHPYAPFRSDSRPSRSRTRSPICDGGFRRRSSRSPDFLSDARMQWRRSPNYQSGFDRNNTSPPPPNSRWVNYKQRSSGFDRRSPPPGAGRNDSQCGERFTFYDSSRNPKQNENYRSGHPGRFSEVHEEGRGGPRYARNDYGQTNHGYRRGRFIRRYDMDRPGKHFPYDEEAGFGPVDPHNNNALEFHGHGSPGSYCNGTETRFRDFPRRPRADRELVTRPPRQEKAPVTDGFQSGHREEKDTPIKERYAKEEDEPLTVDFQRSSREEKDFQI